MKQQKQNADAILGFITILYIIISISTFGYAAANTRACDNWKSDFECKSLIGLSAAALWPLYWSWELQENDGQKKDGA